jgi:hypothetical protein
VEQDQDQGHSPVMRWGLLFGVIIAILGAIQEGLSADVLRAAQGSSTTISTGAALEGVGVLIIDVSFLLLLGLTGLLTSRETGTVGSGAFAGALAAVIGGLVATVVSLALFRSTLGTLPINFNALDERGQHAVIGAVILSGMCSTFIYGLIGAGLAAIGGLIGRAFYNPNDYGEYGGYDGYGEPIYSPAPPGPYQPYQAPPPGYPAYPPYPGGGYPPAPSAGPYAAFPGQPPGYPQYPPQQPGGYPPPPPPRQPQYPWPHE